VRIKPNYLLGLIFLATIVVRLTLAFTIPNFTYESYFHLRQVEHITATGLPLYNDPLSYGGRELIFLPLFHYLTAAFNLFLPLELVAKILPNLLLASLTIIIYLICKKTVKDETASLFSAFVAGFLPILYQTNSFIPETLFIPLTFWTIYAFINLREKNKEKKYLLTYILSFLALSLTSSATFLLIVGLGIYLLLNKLEKISTGKEEIELMLFSLFFFIWIQFLFFKQVLITEGISFIWQNVPSQIINEFFPDISIAQVLVLVSIIPFITGILVAYRSLFYLKNKKQLIFISFVVSTTILAWAKLIKFNLSLSFLAVILAILFASFYVDFRDYWSKTKASWLNKHLSKIIIALLILATCVPAINTSFQQITPSDEEVEAFRWIKDNTPSESTVLALVEEGHLVTYYSQRKNVMDDNFALEDKVEERFNDINIIYKTQFQTKALELTDKYEIDYVILSTEAKERYALKSRFNYYTPECFERLYKEETKVYEISCTLEIKT